jgi:FtsP/CotA-like multicopper oxidase with cupredoxin domain
MSVHIHGLEVRPSFDGNPLAWMGRDGAVGVGFTSLLNEDYYANFKDKLTTSLRADPNSTDIYVKVNRYDNVQAPGNLWYHDHAMHSTLANVALGMAGDYIIHQKETDDHLPSR